MVRVVTAAATLLFSCTSLFANDTAAAHSPRLDQIQFKATHNSYRLADPPRVQIDRHDIWEIELDFGIAYDSEDFLVGHDRPEPGHGFRSLGEWVRDILSAESLTVHPIIIKLEAKTAKPCSQLRIPSFRCVGSWGEDWQRRLRDSLLVWIGKQNCITPTRFESEFGGRWPAIEKLAGKVIVTLQDSNDDRDIDTATSFFFGREIPQLRAVSSPIKTPAEFELALRSGANRLTLDNAYSKTWAKAK